ncbi:MAG: SGNH/GDSL hydrolase family protein [Candidatus Cryptobacteroides sp.]
MQRFLVLLTLAFLSLSPVLSAGNGSKPAVMLDLRFDKGQKPDFLLLNGAAEYVEGGLSLIPGTALAKIDKYYALAERKVCYRLTPSEDAVLWLQSSEGDFTAEIDVPARKVRILTSPVTEVDAPFLEGGRACDIEVFHIYNKSMVRVTACKGRGTACVEAVNDGPGGHGAGVLQEGFNVGMQWDHYCFGLRSGTSALVSRVTVSSLKKKVRMLIYGDSITQPEGYFPADYFQYAWTQRIISRLGGKAMSSGRGGCTIVQVLDYIKNELPYIDTDYVMVTIGTNGGNTEENLSELVEYILSQGCIPVLNNIPCNESGTQVPCNDTISKVRRKYGIKGCMFDLVTSLDGDGKQVDKNQMFFEDYWKEWKWLVYHHPNWVGGDNMFKRTLVDVPEIYE